MLAQNVAQVVVNRNRLAAHRLRQDHRFKRTQPELVRHEVRFNIRTHLKCRVRQALL